MFFKSKHFLLAVLLACALSISANAQTTRPSTRAVNRTDANGNAIRVAVRTGHVSNYDESKVGTYTLPDPLVLADGEAVKDADTWFAKRRPEILHFYETEIYGRVPENAPKVTWTVASSGTPGLNGAADIKRIVGQIGDAAAGPKINLTLYTPVDAAGPTPVIFCINFPVPVARGNRGTARAGGTTLPARGLTAGGRGPIPGGDPIADIIAKGWAYATVTYTDIQPDALNTFTSGVIGLTLAPGQTAPAADEWGGISAWAWGISRIIDYLQSDAAIDPKQIAIMGHSRLGKTVLWAGAQDPRVAVVFSSCGGEMGSSLSRRDYGETIDDMAQNFPWQFAGNFQKYPGHWNDMPVDAHMLIALNAPHPVFIGGGSTDQWSDPKGEFWAEVAAGPVYRLLGKADVGATQVPGFDHPLITGDLGFNYHAGGHMASPTDWKAFLTFAGKYLHGPGK